MRAGNAKLEGLAKAKSDSETVIVGDVLKKITTGNLTVIIKFRLTPIGYGLCSYLKAVLYFDGNRLKTFYTSIPRIMKNLRKEMQVEVFTKFGRANPGSHQMKVEMSGILTSGQPLGRVSSKEFTVDIPSFEAPERRIRRQIIIEKIKGGSGVSIVTPEIQALYKEMEERRKREMKALREGW